jgi:hypothetical protein
MNGPRFFVEVGQKGWELMMQVVIAAIEVRFVANVNKKVC